MQQYVGAVRQAANQRKTRRGEVVRREIEDIVLKAVVGRDRREEVLNVHGKTLEEIAAEIQPIQ